MKKILFASIFLITIFQLNAQMLDPVSWEFTYDDLGNNEYELIFQATMDEGWTVYSQHTSDEGPVPTSITYLESEGIEILGDNEESGKKKEGYDDYFEIDVTKFLSGEPFTIRQKIKVAEPGKKLSGFLTYMTCDDKRCLPPTDEDFAFSFGSGFGDISVEESAVMSLAGEKDEDYESPVSWSVDLEQKDGENYLLKFNADIDEGWNVYSQFTSNDGPEPTYIGFDDEELVEKIGEGKEEGHRKEGPDPLFENVIVVKFLADQPFKITQEIAVKDKSKEIRGYLNFMTCDDSHCLPPEDFDFIIYPDKNKIISGQAASKIIYGEADADVSTDVLAVPGELNQVDNNNPEGSCGPVLKEEKSKSIWGIFVLGFLGGLIALLTPCVFPMIPLTVSFFTKSSGDKKKGIMNALLYGFFIFLVYLILSVPFHVLDNVTSGVLNEISTNVWLNIGFFLVFLFFAFSFFGYYELTLPDSWTNKASSAEGIGGAIGIFFMALTLALVSFSCTGPILGTLLVGALSSNGGAWQLTSGMGGFGLALAIPFAIFAAFPTWLNSLPKSGGWLNTVKVVLGFLELALALKFLSNADLVKHWGLLKIEPFLILWILIFLALGIYLFGKIKFPHDSPIKKLSFLRVSTGVLAIAFAIYLASGFRYNEESGTFTSLKLLSGLAPPAGYSWIYPKECPNNLDCYKDLEEGWSHARDNNKPILIDFTGYACVNCRKMEEHVWPTNEVKGYLKDDYVLISLYVDDKESLDEEQQITVEYPGGKIKKLKTVGNKWEYIQAKYFNTNSQPYYVLLSPDGTLLNQPVAYTPDVEEYANFLKCGVEIFNKKNGLLGSK